MAIEVFNRYETKYLIDTATYNKISDTIKAYTTPDSYSKGDSFYTISNIYYDTKDSSLIRNSLSKPIYKEKLRLRSYGTPKEYQPVFLEIKKKYNGIVNKRRCTIKIPEAAELVEKHIYPEIEDYMNTQVLNEIYYLTGNYKLQPMVYISYKRKAFFGKEDKDLRITFDTDILTRRYNLSLEKGSYGTPLLDSRLWLMEVKCSGALPLWLTRLLSENGIYKTSFSKYGTEYINYLQQEEINYA